jgi:hypothetical protein
MLWIAVHLAEYVLLTKMRTEGEGHRWISSFQCLQAGRPEHHGIAKTMMEYD